MPECPPLTRMMIAISRTMNTSTENSMSAVRSDVRMPSKPRNTISRAGTMPMIHHGMLTLNSVRKVLCRNEPIRPISAGGSSA